jgi:hypothetical protein
VGWARCSGWKIPPVLWLYELGEKVLSDKQRRTIDSGYKRQLSASNLGGVNPSCLELQLTARLFFGTLPLQA